jgi:hypothetical protein
VRLSTNAAASAMAVLRMSSPFRRLRGALGSAFYYS